MSVLILFFSEGQASRVALSVIGENWTAKYFNFSYP
jgi:hypothetical protein